MSKLILDGRTTKHGGHGWSGFHKPSTRSNGGKSECPRCGSELDLKISGEGRAWAKCPKCGWESNSVGYLDRFTLMDSYRP